MAKAAKGRTATPTNARIDAFSDESEFDTAELQE